MSIDKLEKSLEMIRNRMSSQLLLPIWRPRRTHYEDVRNDIAQLIKEIQNARTDKIVAAK